MPITPLPDLLAAARAGRYALGYFEAWDMYSLQGVIAAAEHEGAPVILGFGCLLVDQSWVDAGGIEQLGALGRAAAERTKVPVALLLNEVHTLDQAKRGIEAGFNAVMLCSERAEAIAELVQIAHARGVAVEAELGHLPDADPSGEVDGSRSTVTDPEEARAFVASTGIDCLAVSIGNVHLLERGAAPADLDRLREIARRVDVPLVIHGGTGFPTDAIRGAIEGGVAKFNVGTALKRAFLNGVREAIGSAAPNASPHDLLGSHSDADVLRAGERRVNEVVREYIRLYGGSGQAPERA